MAEQLFPVFSVPVVNRQAGLEEKKYKRSLKWDVDKGDFVVDGGKRIIEDGGKESYKVWCLKVVQTERFTCLGYKSEIGTEMEEAMKQPTHDATQSFIERTISESLLIHPKTEYVREFSFHWEADSVWCSFTVKARNLEEFTLTTLINKG